ncbi:ABC transporter permease [Dehalococcoidia bacterium]|nr:ABC transporter permease [Dehalococcoidia bacterium]
MRAVFWKELADYFGSWRFIIIFAVICLTALSTTYTAAQTIRGDIAQTPTEYVFLRLFTTSGETLPSFIFFLSFFGPLIGIIFGFDVINSERSRGTLSRVLSQPLFRDSVINGKFLAGLTAIAIMLASIILVVSGLGLRMIGVAPAPGEVARIVVFFLISLLYVGFWLGLGILFSVLFRRTITSVLAAIAIWISLALFISMFAGIAANWVAPVDQHSEAEAILEHERIYDSVMRISPTTLFGEATETVLNPGKRTLRGVVLVREVEGMIPGPLALGQSLMLVWPHLVALIALILICFAISYVRFMQQEIRAT